MHKKEYNIHFEEQKITVCRSKGIQQVIDNSMFIDVSRLIDSQFLIGVNSNCSWTDVFKLSNSVCSIGQPISVSIMVDELHSKMALTVFGSRWPELVSNNGRFANIYEKLFPTVAELHTRLTLVG